MDETALLAFGILLEEAGREALGKAGDLVFTEPLTGPKTAATSRVDKAAVVRTRSCEQAKDIRQPSIKQEPRETKRRRVLDDDR
jgi:hypothetical protein